MKLLQLAKKLDFQTEGEYYDYCIESYLNGNFGQSKDLFNAMGRKDKKGLLLFILGYNLLPKDCKDLYNFYFNLL